MRSSLRTLTLLLGLATMRRDVLASDPSSGPAHSRKDAASESAKASVKAAPPQSPAKAPSAAPAANAAGPQAHQETLEEIVARVRRRLATEVPHHAPRAIAPRPAVAERVKLVWRPAVVWPAELIDGDPAAAPAGDPSRTNPRREPR
jgi:hypothetical protein